MSPTKSSRDIVACRHAHRHVAMRGLVVGRFLREGESSDDESGLPTNLKVATARVTHAWLSLLRAPTARYPRCVQVGGGKGTLTRKAQRERRRAAAAAAAATGEKSSVNDEEAAWKQTLRQVARAEEDQRAITKETARISQLLLSGIEPIQKPELALVYVEQLAHMMCRCLKHR